MAQATSGQFVKPPDRTVAVSVPKLREIRALAVALGRTIHSSGYIPREDKIAMLARLKRLRSLVDEELQLDLFSPAQRQR